MFVLCLLIACAIHANAYEKNGIQNVKDYIFDTGLRKAPVERRIFNLKKNGFKIDVKIVPAPRNDSMEIKEDDYFPEFPVKDIGKCVIEFSLGCIKKRFVRFLETITRLDEITLLGQDVKLVKIRTIHRSDGRAMNNTDASIERSLDDFFNSFTLRLTLPRWNSKREKNQIDVMYDETAVVEGRGKKCGGGDKCGGGGGGGKGGKCQMMMMGMLMMVKMKLIALMSMKSMMMGGMSLMLSMMMLMSKFGKGGGGGGGGGPWQSGGGGGGQLKEIVLLTKASGGGGGGGGPSDSYGAPPPSSYGPPSGGGGGYGGGGGWGRSFHKRPMMLSYDEVIKEETANDGSNRTPMVGEVISNAESIDYPDYQDYQKSSSEISSNSMISNWNIANNGFQKYGGINVTADSVKNNSKVETTVSAKEKSFIFNRNPSINLINVTEKNVDSVTSTNQPDVTHKTDMTYTDEWQATAAKINSNNIPSSNSNVRIELQQTESHSKDMPLLRGI
ncbi:osiris 16-like protein [Lasius niger]|uniref:Osiris 16-like protein n=1 Tax=Lasius niger TaxID=67767 RepID=A0A0J7NTB9_LASNI|nr:osiris 16-like protein [Lasius niger]